MTSSPTSPFPRVAPRSNHAVAVQQRHRQAVDLRLGDELELRLLDPLARQVVAHPLHPRPQLLGRADVRQRQHLLGVADLDQVGDRLTADPLRRRVRRQQLGVLGLDRAQLVEQRVVDVVADLRVVEHVVLVAVVLELGAQLGGPLGGARRRRVAAVVRAFPCRGRVTPRSPRRPPARSAAPGHSRRAPRCPRE